MRKRLLSMVMALCMVFCLLPTVATAASESGAGYSYNTSTKALTISAFEGFDNFRNEQTSFKAVVTSLTMTSGVTEIGSMGGLTSLTSVTIPSSVTKIPHTFIGCTGLKNVTLSSNIISMGNGGCM